MSDDYDNFVGKKAEVEKKGTLNEFLVSKMKSLGRNTG